MAEDFEAAVEDGLRLSKRIYFGKDRAVAPPKPPTAMERESRFSYLPTSPMLYAIISDPSIVDNPDMPSYQPHVHGRLDPPALLPLQMNGISLEIDCYLDTAFVTLAGSWRVHCVMGSRACDCRIAIPMGEEGSILGVEVEVPRKSYSTQQIAADREKGQDKHGLSMTRNGGFLKSNIFTLTIPQIDGGTNISVKVRWSQKLLFYDGEFTLLVPFQFPEYVTPAAKKISKREKILLNIFAGSDNELLCRTTSHPLKKRPWEAGKSSFVYEADVLSWSCSGFSFSFAVSPSHSIGALLLSSSPGHDADRGDMFLCCIYPHNLKLNAFRKEVVFAVDISGSMRGKPLEDIKVSLFSALGKLNPGDFFNVIGFNGKVLTFSSQMEEASAVAIEKATQWINSNFVAGGGTNILHPLLQALELFSGDSRTIPIIFLITDGTVEDERNICEVVKGHITNKKDLAPRICTLGIGTFCNNYFLRMLALISRGHHEAAIDLDNVEVRAERLFARASSIFLANTTLENIDELFDLEVFPSQLPDLSSESPLIFSARYHGKFPGTVRVKGVLADGSKSSWDLKVEDGNDIPIDKIIAKHHIEVLTAQAWCWEDKELEKKIAKISVQSAVVSEYATMALFETEKGKCVAEANKKKAFSSKADPHKAEDANHRNICFTLDNLGLGFGDLNATKENIPPGSVEVIPPDAAEAFVKAASNCCGQLCDQCCCMCGIQACSKMNDQCAVAFTQLCGALACLGCYTCCAACCGGED